jgi:hypothetical protein
MLPPFRDRDLLLTLGAFLGASRFLLFLGSRRSLIVDLHLHLRIQSSAYDDISTGRRLGSDRHLNELFVLFYLLYDHLVLLLGLAFGLLLLLPILDHLHLLIIVEVYLLYNHEVVPIDLFVHFHLNVFGSWLLILLLLLLFLVLIPKIAVSGGTEDSCGVLLIALELGEHVIFRY